MHFEYFLNNTHPLKNAIQLFIITALFLTLPSKAGKFNRKREYLEAEVYANYTGECWHEKPLGSVRRISGKHEVCVHHGDKYISVANVYYDENRCVECTCLGGVGFICCKKQLIPTQLPPSCQVDPAGSRSRVPEMARCMTPLIETSSAHRHPSNRETCRNRRLRELLARHVGLSEERFGSRRSMVYRPQKGNSKRHSGFHNIVALAKESQAQLRLVVKLRHGKIIDSFVDTN